MAVNPIPAQLAILQDLLLRDSSGNHQLLAYYLKLILSNRPIELKMPDETPFTISPESAWNEILKWNEKAGLPMGDRGSRKIRASRLLNYLDLVQGTTREAATNFQAIKDSVDTLSKTTPTTVRGQNIKKMVDIRKLQLEIHNRQAIGQLASQLEQTSFIKRFASDRATQIALAGLFAANAANFINGDVPKHVMAQEITKLVQLNAGRTNGLNNAAHLAYSQAAQEKELAEITDSIGKFVSSKYKSRDEFIKETGRISHYSHILTVGDIPELLDMLAPTATPQTRQNLARALQTTVIRSTGDYYTNGETILSHAFNLAGLPEAEAKNLSSLAPFLEEIRGTELHNTISGDLNENDPRILNTLSVSGEVGVSAHIPWLTREDLDAQAVILQKKYGSENLSKTLSQEIDTGEGADFEKISAIKKLFSDTEQYNHYTRTIADNPLYYLRDKIGKTKGRFAAVRAPIDRFSQKIGKKIWAVDDFIHAPFKYVADQLAKLEEKVPLLNPGKFIYDKFSGAQLWVAAKVLDWSDSLIGKGHWASGMLSHVSDFTRGFITEGGSWQGANFVFVQKKWGDLLDWGAKKAKFESWQAVKTKVGTTLWSGFAKMAPGLAEKLSAGSLGKLVASFTAGTLSAGTTLLIQAGLMIVGAGFKKFWELIRNKNGARTKFVNKLPLYIAGAATFLAAVPGAIVAGLIAFGSGAMALIGGGISALFTTIFLPAMIAVGSMILAFFLLFQIFNTTIHLDSGPNEFVASIICNQNSEGSTTTTSPAASAAMCIVETLQGCNLSPLLGSMLDGSAWKCALAAITNPQVAVEIYNSAQHNTYFQCVGFIAATAAWIGKPIPQINACSYVNNAPSGYRYYSNTADMQVGDFFVIGSSNCVDSSPGHVGVVCGVAGTVITACDANYGVAGGVRGDGQFARSQITGFMRPL